MNGFLISLLLIWTNIWALAMQISENMFIIIIIVVIIIIIIISSSSSSSSSSSYKDLTI